MAASERTGDLFPNAGSPTGTVIMNEHCLVRTLDDHRVVIVAGVVLAHYAVGDRMAEAHAMVSLIEQGWSDQNDVARTFGYSSRTVRRYQERFDDGGLAALGRPRGYPKGRRRLKVSYTRRVMQLKAEGLSNRQIAFRVGVSEMAVRKVLRRLGWKPPEPTTQGTLAMENPPANPNLSAFPISSQGTSSTQELPSADPKLSAFSPPDDSAAISFDTDPSDRRFDRLMAYLGLLDDAAPMFQSGANIPGGGVLLAIPALVASGALKCAHEVYGGLGPAFYGLRTTIVALVLMALLRIKRPEALKEHPPQDLGRVLGLDRAPEVKTLRRKLSRLAASGQATAFGRALAQYRIAQRGASLGFLYVDGHVRVYHGQRSLPKAHVAQMRLPMPATTDYWVNDTHGEPLLVVTAEANAGLVKMLPPVLDEVRSLVGERRVTVVFDRGGWSPKLFQKLIAAGFDILTYRKGRFPRVAKSRFGEHTGVFEGRKVTYTLADRACFSLNRTLRLRQVTQLSEKGHQTPIITSRRDLSAVEVAFRMFERWRQENFFKYLRKEYELDALVDYATEPDDPLREVPNPQWLKLSTRLREARAVLTVLPAKFGLQALLNEEARRPTMRGFKIANAHLTQEIRDAVQRFLRLKARRAAVPQRVPVEQVVEGPVVKLAAERKHLTNLLKMVAYQAESDLVRLIGAHYRRSEDEGRTLIQSALASKASFEVAPKELRVILAPLSSAHRTRALAALCEQLNAPPCGFPGTDLKLHFRVGEPGFRPKADSL